MNPDGSWVYYVAKQGRWRVTSGQKPKGFMAAGAMTVREVVTGIVKEVFAA